MTTEALPTGPDPEARDRLAAQRARYGRGNT